VTVLLRIVTPPDPNLSLYARHLHEGAIFCAEHLRQVDVDPTTEEIPDDQVAFWGYRCLMCGVKPSFGQQCANEDCRRPLHPQWPAVYCCNRCAQEDA
jgi:hypothetical protein